MCLADPGRPQEQQGLAVGDPAADGEIADLRLVDRRLGAEVEAIEVEPEPELLRPLSEYERVAGGSW